MGTDADTKLHIPEAVWRQAELWVMVFQSDWHGEIPTKLHTSQLAEDGAPQLAPEFARYLFSGEPNRRNPDDRLRTTRAFRRLRRKAPREFDVLYLRVAHRMSLEKIADELTARAIRIGKPERYDLDAVKLLQLSALDKVIKWW